MKTGKRLYEMGGDVLDDYLPTGGLGNTTQMRNSMLENNSQDFADRDKKRKKTKTDKANAKWQRGAKNHRKPCPSCQ